MENIMTKKISLAQGAGGELMDNLIKEKIIKHFCNKLSNGCNGRVICPVILF